MKLLHELALVLLGFTLFLCLTFAVPCFDPAWEIDTTEDAITAEEYDLDEQEVEDLYLDRIEGEQE